MNFYLFICVALFLLQNSLLFPRWLTGAVLSPQTAEQEAAAAGLVPWFPTSNHSGDFQGYVPDDFTKPFRRGTIVVFHGNAGWAAQRTYYLDAFTFRGFRTFLYEYPGYGGRSGAPKESTIVPDARALIRALDRAGLGPIYVWGESVGAGLAASVCCDSSLPVRGLTLLTPWDSLLHTAMYHYPLVPVSVLLTDRYDSVANLKDFAHPVCVVCSQQDKIIPVSLAFNLFAGLHQPKKLIVQPHCGHNDWPGEYDLKWWDDALDFITSR